MGNPASIDKHKFRPVPHAKGDRSRGGRCAVHVDADVHRRLAYRSLASGESMQQLTSRAVQQMLDRERDDALKSGKLPWEMHEEPHAAARASRWGRWLRRLRVAMRVP